MVKANSPEECTFQTQAWKNSYIKFSHNNKEISQGTCSNFESEYAETTELVESYSFYHEGKSDVA